MKLKFLFVFQGGYHQFCIKKSPYKKLVSHDDNLGDQVLETQGMSTKEFWDSCYGKDDYMNKRVFFEPIGDGGYNKLSIKKNKCPGWLITGIVIGFLCVIVTVISIIDGWYEIAIVIDIIGGIIACILGQMKCCDKQRGRLSKGRNENRGDCGGGCGAACVAYVENCYDMCCYGCGEPYDGDHRSGVNGGCGGGCSGCGGCGGCGG